MHPALSHPDDFHLAQECLEGKTSALAYLQETFREPLLAFLQKAGGLPHEAAEIVTEVWSDCVASQNGTKPKLAHYNGLCSLKTFLNTITLNVLLTRRRKDRRMMERPMELPVAGTEETVPAGAAEPSKEVEKPLLELMREAIQAAFMACPAEDFVLLQLAHMDDLRVVELATMFDCGIASVSRELKRAGREIEEATLQYIKATDPWLQLEWKDFLDLCRSASPACFGVE